MREIILASASERRSRILSECGIRHRVVPSGVEEMIGKSESIREIVQVNASKKAGKVALNEKKAVVIGADTLVVCGSEIIGKPEDERAAKELLRKFSGAEVEVYTGLCVYVPEEGLIVKGVQRSGLIVMTLTEKQVDKYFNLLGPYDKAGGFSIEGVGSLIFDDIKGSYFNILGLPMIKLGELFKKAGMDILDYVQG